MATLNPKIVGWANYYSRQNSSEVFSRLDHLLWQKLWPWATRRHPTKSHAWVKERYWPTRGRRRWVFGLRDGTALARHAATTIDEHVKVKGDASFFDGNVVYWASRLGRHPELPKSKAELLKRQQGRCARCGLFFTDMHEVMESDHRRPRSLGEIVAHPRDDHELGAGYCLRSHLRADRRHQRIRTAVDDDGWHGDRLQGRRPVG